MNYNIILHTTTSCNYNCSYCDVIKDGKKLDNNRIETIVKATRSNHSFIDSFKFFGGEPLLVFDNIKKIIDNTHDLLGEKYQIVTNTSILNNEIGNYFSKFFEIIFFSIDSENKFDYVKVKNFINKHKLEQKVYFNLIINPGNEENAYNQFVKLYNCGFKNFNLLPVYFTKEWKKENLLSLSLILKKIIDKSLTDKEVCLFGFQKNNGYNSSLVNDNLFINIDLEVYYSDIVSTNLGEKLKKELYISDLSELSFEKLSLDDMKINFEAYEKKIMKDIKGQRELHKIMDYFSEYLNAKVN